MPYDNHPYDNYPYEYYRDSSRYKAKHSYDGRPPSSRNKRKNVRRRLSNVIYAIVIAVLGLLIVAIAATMIFSSKIDANLHNFPPEDQKVLDAALSPSSNFALDPSYVLLLGSDARPDDPELGGRTDAIVLARIDPKAGSVQMVSIPRDTMVELPEVGTSKINAAYTFGGADGAVEAVERLCNVKIDHCAVVDFNGLSGLVDAVGGIDVFLEEGIDDPLAGDVTVDAGQQHINGAQALVVSRSRDWADGDYTRQLNQRKVISGILHRMVKLPIWEMPSAIEGVSQCVSTDSGISSLNALILAARMKMAGDGMRMSMVSLPSEPAYIDDIAYVIADTAGTAELMERMNNGQDIEAPLTTSSIADDLAYAGAWY